MLGRFSSQNKQTEKQQQKTNKDSLLRHIILEAVFFIFGMPDNKGLGKGMTESKTKKRVDLLEGGIYK